MGFAAAGVDATASAPVVGLEDSEEFGLGSLLSSGTDMPLSFELPVVAACGVQLLVRQSLANVIAITTKRSSARLRGRRAPELPLIVLLEIGGCNGKMASGQTPDLPLPRRSSLRSSGVPRNRCRSK
jgi:hypothetical protein